MVVEVDLPVFRYHPDPIRSGSIVESTQKCRSCRQARGYIYTGPVYSEENLDDSLCPWCIAEGLAHEKFGAEFVDVAAFPEESPDLVVQQITRRTPGYNTWQGELWPVCCGDATAFLMPAGTAEIRAYHRELESSILGHIIYDMQISGGAAIRMLESLDRENGPTLHLFQCLECQKHHFYVDQP
jgi:uncharacterized protein CbrC (UPF0167 family)